MTKFELIENMINNHFENDGWNIYKFETAYWNEIVDEVEGYTGAFFDAHIIEYMSGLFTQYENNKQTKKGDDMTTKIEALKTAYETSSAALTAFDRIADDMKAAPQSVKNAFYTAYEIASSQYESDRKAYMMVMNELNALQAVETHNRELYIEISAFFDNLKDDTGEGFTLPKTVYENLERSVYEAKMHWHDAETKLATFVESIH
jgi:hypothetical protein